MDHTVIGDKIAQLVYSVYENELKQRDTEINRLQKENAELKAKIDGLENHISKGDSWNGSVDRQGGSFSDQEIIESLTWR